MNRLFKDSGVEWIGKIPQHLSVIKIKKIAEIKSGEYVSKELYNDGGEYDIIGSNGKIGSINKCNNTEEVITTGRVGTIGSCRIVKKCWITDNTLILKVNNKIRNKYLYYTLPNIDYKFISSGTAQPLITATNLKNQYIPFCSLEEQDKIIDYLDRKLTIIDEVIKNTAKLIQEYKKYKYALITKCVTKGINKNVQMKSTEVDWIGKIPEDWEYMRLKYIFSIKKDIAGKEGFDILSVTQSGLKIKDISKNEGQISADYSKYQIVEKGDFVMNHMDLLTGWVDCSKYYGVTSPDYRVFKFKTPELYSSEYYTYIMQICYKNKIFYGLGQGVSNLGRWRLQTDKFLNFILPVPPKEEQEQIVNYLDNKCTEIDNIIEQKQKLLVEMEAYKKSLIYECVTGKREVK